MSGGGKREGTSRNQRVNLIFVVVFIVYTKENVFKYVYLFFIKEIIFYINPPSSPIDFRLAWSTWQKF